MYWSTEYYALTLVPSKATDYTAAVGEIVQLR